MFATRFFCPCKETFLCRQVHSALGQNLYCFLCFDGKIHLLLWLSASILSWHPDYLGLIPALCTLLSGWFDDKEIFLSWQGSVGTRRKSFFRGKVQKEGNYFFPVVVLIVTSLSWERNCSRLLGQCTAELLKNSNISVKSKPNLKIL